MIINNIVDSLKKNCARQNLSLTLLLKLFLEEFHSQNLLKKLLWKKSVSKRFIMSSVAFLQLYFFEKFLRPCNKNASKEKHQCRVSNTSSMCLQLVIILLLADYLNGVLWLQRY